MRNLLFCRLSTVSCQQPMEINFCKLILKQLFYSSVLAAFATASGRVTSLPC